MDFKSTHRLIFESRHYNAPFDDGFDWQQFKIGTCTGLWTSNEKEYLILAVMNSEPNNGHFKDVLDWFQNSCKRDKKHLKIKEFFSNQNFKKHLIKKQGFKSNGKDDVIKKYKTMKL